MAKNNIKSTSDENLKCSCCGKEKKNTEFYLSKSILNNATGRLSICKLCMGKIYTRYLEKFKDTREAIYYLCRKLDICYSEMIFKTAMSEVENGKKTPMFQLYMTKLNSIEPNNGAGSDFDESDTLVDDEINEEEIKNMEEVLTEKDLVKTWGYGWTLEELQWLENNYSEWCTRHECNSLSLERLFQMISIKELEIRKARECNKPTDKLEKSLRELLNDSNLTPKNMTALNETESTKTFGLWLKDIEQRRPAEVFDNKTLYEDHDGINEYFERFVLRPMKNLLCGTREFDSEFNVEDEGDE